jgi:hypothetical protein
MSGVWGSGIWGRCPRACGAPPGYLRQSETDGGRRGLARVGAPERLR